MGKFELKVEIKELPIEQIFENIGQIPDVPENPRTIKDEDFELLKKSIIESPEMKNLDEVKVYPYKGSYIAIGGNHRLRAYKELGWKSVLCKVLPKDTPKEKICEYIMKENMQYASNDPYKLQDWNQEKLEDWGVDVPQIIGKTSSKKAPNDISDIFHFEYRLEIICKDEKQQQEMFNEMERRGLECHILTL